MIGTILGLAAGLLLGAAIVDSYFIHRSKRP